MDDKGIIKMIKFQDFLKIEVTEQEVNDLIESLEWEDVIELFDEKDMIIEGLSATERLKRGNKMRSRKTMLSTARNVKLKRAANLDVLKRRSKLAARKMIMKKLLKGRSKSQLSAAEKSALEARIAAMLKMIKNMPERLLPKVREIEKKRLKSKNK